MFNFIKNIIQAIKELKELEETECSGNDICQLSQEQLERYGEESFRKYQEMLNEEISDEDYAKLDEQFNNIKESYNSKSPFSFRDDVAYFFLVTLPRKFKKNNI